MLAKRFGPLVLFVFAAILHGAVAELSLDPGEIPTLTLHGARAGARLQLLDGVSPIGVAIADRVGVAHFATHGLPSGPHTVRVVEWGTGQSVAGATRFTLPVQPAGSFAPSVVYATGIAGAKGLQAADFHGGHLPDLVFCSTAITGEGSVSLMRNNGDAFSAPVKLATLFEPAAIAVQDFNGDGRNDLAIAGTDGRVAVLLNRGGGEFSAVHYFSAGARPSAIVSGDFNSDGIPDLAVANQDDNTVSILLGNGDGTFQLAAAVPAGYSPRALVVADFDGDGRADLATANFNGNDVSLLLGDGKGSFRSAGAVAAGNGPVSLAVADFNQDGAPDLAVLNRIDGHALVLLNDGAAGFRLVASIPDAAGLAVGDVDGSGRAGLVLQSGAQLLVRPGLGDGSFVEGYAIPAGASSLLALGDFNADGRLDIGAVDPGGTLTVLSGMAVTVPAASPAAAVLPSVVIDSLAPAAAISGALTISGWALDNTTTMGTAIGGVQMMVDGTVVGNATYGTSRIDVCSVYPGRPGCPNVGFAYLLNTLSLTPGPHTVTAVAMDTNSPPNTASFSVAVTVVGLPAPSVVIDSLASGASLSGTVTISGWALDNTATIGAPVAGVQIQVDGAVVGNAAYGSSRIDVCSAYAGRLGCPNVGFAYQLNTRALTSGPHTITAVAMDTNSPPISGSYSVSVIVLAPPAPSVVIDSLPPGATVSGAITVSGWALDNTTAIGAAIAGVQLKVDGTLVGNATYGIPRSDVCAAYPGRLGCPNVGFSYQLNTASLSSGIHTITAVASDTNVNPAIGSFSVNVKVSTLASATTLVSSLNPSTYFQNVTLTATVSPSSASGAVTFENNGAVLGTKTLVNGQAALTTGQLGTGTRSLRAYYSGDGTYGASLSAVLAQTVTAGSANGFQSPVNYAGAASQSVAVGDFNADGKPDLAVAEGSAVAVFLGRGDGTFQAAVNYPAGGSAIFVAVGDFSGDGKPDLVVTNNGSGTISVLLNRGDGTFQAPVSYAAGSSPQSIAVGDFNADGKPDLAVANNGSGTVSVLLGRGDGTFQPAVSYPAGSGPVALAIGDFNGDGNGDLAVTTTSGGVSVVAVLLGNGTGAFQAPMTYPVGASPTSLAVGDFNADGKPDLAVANAGANNLSVLLGNGDGTFKTAVNYNAGIQPSSIVIGDFNADGKPDLAVANAGASNLSVLLGNGDGTFRTAVNFTAGNQLSSIAIGDFNADGKADLAVANNGSSNLGVLLGTTAGSPLVNVDSLASGATVSGAVTISGWAIDDTASTGTAIGSVQVMVDGALAGNATYGTPRSDVCAVYAGRPGCPNVGFTYQLNTASLSSGAHTLAVVATEADFTQDSALYSLSVSVLASPFTLTLSTNSAAFGQPVTLTARISSPGATGRVTFYDGASPLDTLPLTSGQAALTTSILAAGSHSISAYYSGDAANGSLTSAVLSLGIHTVASSGFQAPVNDTAGSSPYGVAVGDFNGDGKADLVVANSGSFPSYAGSVSVLLGNGDGTFKTPVAYPTGIGSSFVAVGDFNGDGRADLAVANWNGTVSVLLGNGDGTFQAASTYSAGNTPFCLAVGDFNGDGKADLAVANSGDNTVSVLLSNGDGTFQKAVTYFAGTAPQSIAVGDLNGDGRADLAVAVASGVAVLLGNGDGTFQGPLNYVAGANPYSVTIGDFNGDGRADLAVADLDGGTVSVLLGAGSGGFLPVMNYAVDTNPECVVVGDFNGDGKPDLATANFGAFSGSGGDVTILLGNGDGTFQGAVNYTAGLNPFFAAVADFNGDGRADLAVVNVNGNNASVLLGKP